jgi:hypothetical protein
MPRGRRILKRILLAVGLLAAAAVAAVVVLWIYLDAMVAAALTRGIEQVGQVRCTVGHVGVSLLSGRIGIEDLVIRSPAGYPEGEMFRVRRADLQVRIRSFWNQPVAIHRLEVLEPVVSMEAGAGGSNVRLFLDNVQAWLDRQEREGRRPTRMCVDQLVVRGATVRMGAGVTGRTLLNVTVPAVELRDVRGPGGRGVTSGELAATVIVELVYGAAVAGKLDFRTLIPPELIKGLRTVLATTSVLQQGLEMFMSPLKTIWRSIPSPGDEPSTRPEGP